MSIGFVLEAPDAKKPGVDDLYEIIDGQIVETPPMSASANKLANRLARHLNACAWPDDGEAFHEMLFHLALPVDRNRRPDVAYVSFERWAKDRQLSSANAWDVTPNLIGEIVSPTDLIEELMEKIDEYFRSGVELVWVVYPTQRLVQVFESMKSSRLLSDDEVLDGGKVLPQFRLALKDYFISK